MKYLDIFKNNKNIWDKKKLSLKIQYIHSFWDAKYRINDINIYKIEIIKVLLNKT
jgi:hypothetical protein